MLKNIRKSGNKTTKNKNLKTRKIIIKQEDLNQLIFQEKKDSRFTRKNRRELEYNHEIKIAMRDTFGYNYTFDHVKLISKLKAYFTEKHPYMDISKIKWREHMNFVENFPEAKFYCFAIGAKCQDYKGHAIFKDFESKSCGICHNKRDDKDCVFKTCLKLHTMYTKLYDIEILIIRELCKLF